MEKEIKKSQNCNKNTFVTDYLKISSDGVLKKYTGQEAVVTVPEGVTKIGVWAFHGNEAIKEVLQRQIRSAADAFAMDMLLAKFVQGLPLAGIAGGLTNPVYYSRILKFVQMKYRKRYLLRKYRENGS